MSLTQLLVIDNKNFYFQFPMLNKGWSWVSAQNNSLLIFH